MAEIEAKGPTTGAAVETLREQVRGRVITAATMITVRRGPCNGMFDRRPLAVLAPSRWLT